MNTETIPTRRVESGKIEKPGDFCFSEDRDYIYIWIPGMSGPDAIRIETGPDQGNPRVWSWDGNEKTPTLSPSIHAPGEWHGYLRAGILESC